MLPPIQAVPTTNPVGRLYVVLHALVGKKHSIQARRVLKEYFGEKNDDLEFFSSLAALHELIKESKRAIEFYTNERSAIFAGAISQIEKAFNYDNLSAGWGDVERFLDDGTLSTLASASALIEREYHDEDPDKEALERIAEQAESLISEIRESDLDKELKAVLLDICLELRRATEQFIIRGTKGLRKAIAVSVFTLKMHEKEIDGTGFSSKFYALVLQIWKVLAELPKIESVISGGLEIVQRIK